MSRHSRSSPTKQADLPPPKMEQVPPIRALLEGGIPTQGTLDMYISDLDSQLEENSKQFDNCLQDILSTCNTIPGNRHFSSPKDAINNIISTHIIEKDSCYDPESEDVLTILSHVIYTLEQCPGSEERVLQDLLSLSSKEGLSLPIKSHVATDPMQSVTSVNAVTDNLEFQIAQHWDQIALHLRRYFTDSLTKLPIDSEKPILDLYETKRIQYIQSLLSLYPSDDILIKYQTLRSQQLEHCFQTLLPDADSEQYNSVAITRNCRELSDIILKMIDEDFVVFNSGIFKKSFNIARAMHDMYLEKFSDEMSVLVEDIWEDIEEILKKRPSQSSSEHSKLGHKVKLPNKEQSQSMDSILTSDPSDEPILTEFSLPRDYIESILNVVTSVLHIEEHVESLLRCAAWDPAGVSSKRIKRKGSLRGVLKASSSPEPQRRPLSYTSDDVSFSESFNSSFGSMPISMTDSTPAPRVIERTRGEERLRWEWKLMFKKIALDLSQCVDKQIRNLLKSTLDKELNDWMEMSVLVTEPVREDLWGGKLDYPKCATKSVIDFMSELDFLLPFARAGTDGSILQSVRTAFVNSASLCLQNFHVHLTKLSSDIPRNAPMKSLYAILASAAYVKNHLLHYESVLTGDDSSKKLFSGLYKNYVDLVDALSKLTIEIHNNFMATSILHDVESYNWADNKEFYEGERCAFPIQMWNYHLRGLHYDLWHMCPPRLSQNIYSVVLNNSIQILTQRYAHSKPTYRRTPQFKTDIVSLLLCTHELLFPACCSVSKYLDVGSSQLPHYNIHNSCSTLLSIMAVVSSPLEVLYKMFKRGYHEKPDLSPTEMGSPTADVIGSNTDWLSWIQSGIFQSGYKHYDDMRTTTALYFQCKLLLSQPEVDWGMVVQTLIMKEYTLPILFLTQSVLKSSSLPSSPGRQEAKTISVARDPSVKQLFTVITRVLSQCLHFTDSIAKVIIPVIDRSGEWKMLDTKTVPGRDCHIPVWMDTLFDLLDPFVHRVIKPVLEYILMELNTGPPIRPIMSVIAELPCGCRPQNPSPAKPKKGDSQKETIDTALRQIISQIAEDVYSIPAMMGVLMKSLQEHCATSNIKTPHQCVGLKILGSCLRARLCDAAYLEHITGMSLNQTNKNLLETLGECVYYVLVSTKAKSTSTPKLGGKFCKENKEWVVGKIQMIGSYLNSQVFEIENSNILEGATNEFMSQLFTLMSSNILDSTTGKADLKNLHNLISNNFQWLEKQFDIQCVLPTLAPKEEIPDFTLSLEPKAKSEFDPNKEFEMIGTRKFDHVVIENFQIDWQKLLMSDLGLSEFGFRCLLYNRHEFQDGAYLEDNEKRPVEVLKSVYENEHRELG